MATRLQTLKPRIQAAKLERIKMLDTKAGATERIRGRAWMKTRERVALAHDYRCAGCGCVWVPSRDQIDHAVPLEQGGSNDDSNLRPLCDDCHKAKTADEARLRGGAG
jgi:5-methylcytosine-specific restriction endonuclease McrA